MKNKLKSTKAITLVALIITVIVMLILVGVVVSVVINSNLLGTAKDAVEKTKTAYEQEENFGADEVEYYLEKSNYPSKEAYVASKTINDGANFPKLVEGMQAVYWEEDGTEVPEKLENGEDNPNFKLENWYNYNNKRWANAKTEDGSYWVWIPRYAYKIESGLNSNETGTISIKFLQGTTNKDKEGNEISITYPTTSGEGATKKMDNYVVHPAFINGTSNKFKNGEWDKEISGIWVAKYEMSQETSTDGENWTTTELSTVNTKDDTTKGNVLTTKAGNTATTKVRAVSKPGVLSWRWITVGTLYTNSYAYDRNKESHLMKNSEWGAVAYLAHSQYGRNGTELTVSNTGFYTGGGEGEAYKTNVGQSTTGNVSGIYDLSGGVWERPAGYITNGHGNLTTYGSSFVKTAKDTKDKDGYLTLSTKYATVYPYYESDESDATTEDSNTNNYTAYSNIKATTEGYGYGDAILETSNSGSGYKSWNNDYSGFAYAKGPFFSRGGSFADGTTTGLFAVNFSGGATNWNNGFRVVLVVQ